MQKARQDALPHLQMHIVLILFLAVVGFFAYFTPIGGGDFFWHVKSGEWIWEHRSLPSADPFSYTTPASLTATQRFTLTSYWLSQIIYHFTVREAGLGGIVFLNLFILGALLLAIYLGREGDDLLSLGLMIIFLCVLRLVPLERPQSFSFVFFATLLAVLSRLRGSPPGTRDSLIWAAAVPLLMVIWSNFHGAYLLGQMVLVLATAAAGVQFLRSQSDSAGRAQSRILVFAGVAGLLGSLANPNGWHAVEYILLGGSPIVATNIEYQSPLALFRQMRLWSLGLYALILALCIPALLFSIRRPDLPSIALLLLLGFYSLKSSRYVPFFCIAALPFIGRGLSGTRWTPWIRGCILAIALAAGSTTLWNTRGNLHATLGGGWLSGRHPVGAADFILAHDPQGNIFNVSNWGGYLIWRLGPRRQVFADSRGLDERSFLAAEAVEYAQSDPTTGIPVWQAVFSRYDIGVAALPVFALSGHVSPLAMVLLDDPDWSCAFVDSRSTVLLRRSPANLKILGSRGIPRERVLDYLSELCKARLEGGLGTSSTAVSQGEIHLKRGRLSEARATYALALRMEPGNRAIQQRLAQLERMSGVPAR